MQEAKTYRQFAEDCRRLAQTMTEKDKRVLLNMAEAWDSRADEAECVANKRADGKDHHA